MRRLLILILLSAASAFAQGGQLTQNPWVSSRQGNPVAGATVAICQPLATTAASVTSNLAVFTMASNPISAGFVQGMRLQVAGFTGADTYFNAGTLAGGTLTGGLSILSVTTTTVTVSLTHANASASSNGTLLQMGNSATACAGLSTIYTDAALGTATANPLTTDGLGNYSVFAAPGVYYTQVYGSGITTTLRQTPIPCVPSTVCNGPITNAQLPNPMATGPLTVTGGFQVLGDGTPNVQFGSVAFPNTQFGFEFQSPGVPTILANGNGLGDSQLQMTSKFFQFIPAISGGNFGFGTNGAAWSATSDTGKVVFYNSAAAAGNGQSAIRSAINQTGEVTGNSGTLTLTTPANSSSVYRLTIYTTVSTGVATATIQWTASYTDVTGAATVVGTSINAAVTGTKLGESFIIESQSSVAITLATATANSPRYKYYVRLEEL